MNPQAWVLATPINWCVTRDTIDATSPSLATYDAFAQSQAALNAALSGILWRAIVATRNEPDPVLNAGISAPVYRLDGGLIDNTAGVFWDQHDREMRLDQFNNTKNTKVWTGAHYSGVITAATLGSISAFVGLSSAGGGDWSSRSTESTTAVINILTGSIISPPQQYSIYAVSEVLSVPAAVVPLPGALSVFASGFGMLVWAARRRRISAAA